jgi:hypothetical protein
VVTAVPSEIRPRKVSAYAWLLALLTVLAFVDAFEPTNDPDVYWHLRIGRTVLEAHDPLSSDIYSYAFHGPWRYKDILAEVILYAGFARFGYAWFVALKVATVGAIAASCFAIVRLRDRHPLVIFVCTGLIVDSFWLVERPNLFSMAFFAVALALVERARRCAEEDSGRAIAWAFAPIIGLDCLWSFLHTFVLLGYLLVFGFAAATIASRLGGDGSRRRALFGPTPSRSFVRGAVVAAIAGPLLGLVNPNGVDMWRGVVGFAANPGMRSLILEWQRLTPTQLARAFPIATASIAVAVLAVCTRVAFAVRSREADPPVTLVHVATLVGVGAMALSTVRWLPFAAILAPLYLAPVLGDALSRRALQVPRGTSTLAGSVLFVLLRLRQGDTPLAIGEDGRWSPAGAVAFAADHGLRGRVANSMEFGGYILFKSWPEVLDLVDGRLLDVTFDMRCLQAERDEATFSAMRDEDGATWALAVNRPDQVAFGFLAGNPRWAMVYWSETAAVYVRRDTHADLMSFAFRFVDPYDVPGSVSRAIVLSHGAPDRMAAIVAEVRRMLEVSPESIRANLGFAAVLTALGPERRADRDAVLAHLLLMTADSPKMKAFVQMLRDGQ